MPKRGGLIRRLAVVVAATVFLFAVQCLADQPEQEWNKTEYLLDNADVISYFENSVVGKAVRKVERKIEKYTHGKKKLETASKFLPRYLEVMVDREFPEPSFCLRLKFENKVIIDAFANSDGDFTVSLGKEW